MDCTPSCPSPFLQWKCPPSCSQQEVLLPSPSLSVASLWHNSSWACFYVSHDEDDKTILAGERRLKNGLNYPLCRGDVSSCCVVFITVMFTFISTCLKCVTISFPSLSRTEHSLTRTASRCYQAKKMFCLPSISKAVASVKILLVWVQRRYCSFKRAN